MIKIDRDISYDAVNVFKLSLDGDKKKQKYKASKIVPSNVALCYFKLCLG